MTPCETKRRHERRTWAVALLAAAAAAVELGGGWLTGSSALLAEGLHMGAHVSAFGLAGGAYVAARLLARAGRAGASAAAPDVAALFNGVLLLWLSLDLAGESVGALLRPRLVAFAPALGVAAFGLVVNLASAALLHHDHAHEAGHAGDMNFRAIHLHVIGDGLVALLAILGLLLGRWLDWRWTDAAAGLLGAALAALLGFQVTLCAMDHLGGGRARGAAIGLNAARRHP